tara:strand:+ start:280 stop:819 length:540 start_codon:yes stop_codon:yes gene_type:complete
MSGMWSSKMASLLNEEETQKKAAKWDSLMKWIKESSETYDSDCDNGRDVDTIWDKLDELDYKELNSKDLKIKVLDKELEEYEINVGVEGEEILLVNHSEDLKKENKELKKKINGTISFIKYCDTEKSGIYTNFETRAIASILIDGNITEDSDSEEEEEICPSCGEEWTDATRCDCPEKW